MVSHVPTPPRIEGESSAAHQFLAEALADNLRAARSHQRLTQPAVAERMRALGHRTWSANTVSHVERAQRSISLYELVSLGLVLEASLQELLEPRRRVDVGTDESLTAAAVSWLLDGLRPLIEWRGDGSFDIVGADYPRPRRFRSVPPTDEATP